MNELRIINMIKDFPIGEQAKTRAELLSKAEIVSYLSRFQEQFSTMENVEDIEYNVKQFLEEIIGLENGETIPDLLIAEKLLNLTPGFLQDYSKIAFIKQNNPSFNKTFAVIANSMEMTNTHSKSR